MNLSHMSYKDFTVTQVVRGDTITLTPKANVWETVYTLLSKEEICKSVELRFDGCKASVVTKQPYLADNVRSKRADYPSSWDLHLRCTSEEEARCIARHFLSLESFFRSVITRKYKKENLKNLSSEKISLLIKLGFVTDKNLDDLAGSGLEEFLLHDLGV